MPTPYYPGITLTPFLGLSLIGMDEVVAQDFILIDAFAEAAGASIEVNGSVVNSPNFTDSATVTFTVVGSDISLTAAGGGSGSGLNLPTAGSTSPTPVFPDTEAPTSVNPSFYVQDANGQWHPQAGMDTTTVTDPTGTSGAPTVPQGILVNDRIQYMRDTQTPTQSGKNALLSINHEASVGTSYNNQDRAIWAQMGNVTGAITAFSIASNVVTFVVTASSLFTAGVGFRKGQRVVAAGLSIGTYLNTIPLSVQSAGAVSGGVQTITASDSGFTHANVGNTSDSGTLDQAMYAMEVMQAELDIVGTPTIQTSVDGEFTTLSLQLSDNHVGTVGSPNNGVNCIRAQSYREIGAGNWGSISPAVLFIKHTNFSAVNGGGTTLEGIRVVVNDDGANSVNLSGTGVHIVAPGNRMAAANVGLQIGNFGSNVNDFAIQVIGGQTFLNGPVSLPSLSPAGASGGNIAANGSLSAQGFTSTATAAPAAPDVEVIGATGSTHYTYVVVGRDSNGNPSPGTPRTITNGNATLDGTNWNFIEIGPNPAMGPTTFDVYRTQGGATQGKIASVTPSFQSFNQFGSIVVQDKGLVADGSTAPTINGSGSIAAAGPVSAGQYTVAGLPVGFEGQMLYATNGLKVGEITGNGTGVPVYFSSSVWRVFSTDAAVAS